MLNNKTMKNYIGSQQHFEDSVNAHYDKLENEQKQYDNIEQPDNREPPSELAELNDKYQEVKAENERLKANQLPDGFKVYKCTDCQEINVIHNNGDFLAGFCSNCLHPLWN
jgi:hypothetical protein